MAYYHYYGQRGELFLKFNSFYQACLLIKRDPKNRIVIPDNLFDKFQKLYVENGAESLRTLEPLARFQEGVICLHAFYPWESWASLKHKVVSKLEEIAADIEILILDGLKKISSKDTEKLLERVFGHERGDYEEEDFEEDGNYIAEG